jgi:hypothetical protein
MVDVHILVPSILYLSWHWYLHSPGYAFLPGLLLFNSPRTSPRLHCLRLGTTAPKIPIPPNTKTAFRSLDHQYISHHQQTPHLTPCRIILFTATSSRHRRSHSNSNNSVFLHGLTSGSVSSQRCLGAGSSHSVTTMLYSSMLEGLSSPSNRSS